MDIIGFLSSVWTRIVKWFVWLIFGIRFGNEHWRPITNIELQSKLLFKFISIVFAFLVFVWSEDYKDRLLFSVIGSIIFMIFFFTNDKVIRTNFATKSGWWSVVKNVTIIFCLLTIAHLLIIIYYRQEMIGYIEGSYLWQWTMVTIWGAVTLIRLITRIELEIYFVRLKIKERKRAGLLSRREKLAIWLRDVSRKLLVTYFWNRRKTEKQPVSETPQDQPKEIMSTSG